MESAFRRYGLMVLVLGSGVLAPRGETEAQSAPTGLGNGLFGIHYGAPLKWSVLFGTSLPFGSKSSNAFVAAEPGIGGWRASVGYAPTPSSLGAGYSARATALRTTDRAWRADAQSTFVGVELQYLPMFALGARVGGFTRLNSGGGSRGLLTADVGFAL
ncbi:MAG: hypothetical protein NVS4B3_13850 [Gemmatimonadaceae bacterium]